MTISPSAVSPPVFLRPNAVSAMKSDIQAILRVLCLVVSLASTAAAADNRPTRTEARSQPAWTVNDVLSEEDASGFKISPGCHWVVWEKGGNLFLTGLTAKKEIQRTHQGDASDRPKWSPDGRLIAFLSSRPNPQSKAGGKGSAQIWLMKPFEGEPWPATAEDEAVLGFDWSGTNSIIFSMQMPPAPGEQTNTDDSIVVGDESEAPLIRLFRVDVSSGKVTALTRNKISIWKFWVSPNGRFLVTIEIPNSYLFDLSAKPLMLLTDLSTGQRRQIFSDAEYGIFSVHWERDSSGFYAVGLLRAHLACPVPSIPVLYHYALATDVIEPVDLGWEKGLFSDTYESSSQIKIGVTEHGFLALLADGVRPRLARFSHVGSRWQREFLTGVHSAHVFDFEIGRDDKTFVYEYSTASVPSQWYQARLEGAKMASPRQLTRLNAQFQFKPMAKSEIVHWKGALGDTVEGTLFYPLDYQAGRKYPLVVQIHGGSPSLYMDRWDNRKFMCNNNLLNARGAFVFRPNYHGSANYGLKWIEAIIGRIGQLEVKDIETGVDYLIRRGLVDPDKLAVMGWSYGGALTASVTASTRRYKAAISIGGVVDWADFWARSDLGIWIGKGYFGKSPLEDPQLYAKASSFYQLNNVVTPTLILSGTDDYRVPVEQDWMYYRALQQSGKADVRFVLFPGDGHLILHHAKQALQEELAWLDKYLLN